MDFTQEELDQFAAEWKRAHAGAAAHMEREWRRLRRELPRRVRLRLWRDRSLTRTGIWLCNRKRYGCAVTLWRVFGMWS